MDPDYPEVVRIQFIWQLEEKAVTALCTLEASNSSFGETVHS